jgi:DNA polymerase-3 subunit gamma/tau
MLKLGGLIALIALAAAAFWLATSYDREPSVSEQATQPPAQRESIEARPEPAQPAPAAPEITRAPAGAPPAAGRAPAATPVQEAATADGQGLPPLVLPPPEPPPTQLW